VVVVEGDEPKGPADGGGQLGDRRRVKKGVNPGQFIKEGVALEGALAGFLVRVHLGHGKENLLAPESGQVAGHGGDERSVSGLGRGEELGGIADHEARPGPALVPGPDQLGGGEVLRAVVHGVGRVIGEEVKVIGIVKAGSVEIEMFCCHGWRRSLGLQRQEIGPETGLDLRASLFGEGKRGPHGEVKVFSVTVQVGREPDQDPRPSGWPLPIEQRWSHIAAGVGSGHQVFYPCGRERGHRGAQIHKVIEGGGSERYVQLTT
jgi:hypothetical protein